MNWLDWLIVIAFIALLAFVVNQCRGLMRSVTDFLSAGRSAGRYMICVSQGMAGVGSISIIAMWQMNFAAGFCQGWWSFSMALIVVLSAVSGWITYRFRQTRCLTLAQFFEIRYSRNFRIFTGILGFVSGILNFGIFPAVGANFFLYFCNLPHSLPLPFGFYFPTYPLVMLLFLSFSLLFVFLGGQVAVILTEFVQGLFSSVIYLVIALFIIYVVGENHIIAALLDAPKDASLVNPFHTGSVKDFNFEFFAIAVVIFFYSKGSWQGTQGYNSSALNAHEARMSDVLSNFRDFARGLMILLVPIAAYTVLKVANWHDTAAQINASLTTISNPEVRNEMTVPMTLAHLLPHGLIGCVAAMMLMATIGCNASYMHSWGSILIQDVIMPFRKKPFAPESHIKYLRIAIIGVCVFIFLFSLVFQPTQKIMLFFSVSASVYIGGAGAAIIGGLYWSRGTAAGAWTAMTLGAAVALIGTFVKFKSINGQEFSALSIALAVTSYIVVSLITSQKKFDMKSLLHPLGSQEDEQSVEERLAQSTAPTSLTANSQSRFWKMLGVTDEFTRGDKIIYVCTYVWTFAWVIVFIIGTAINLTREVRDQAWVQFWRTYTIINIAAAVITIIWFSFGGLRDFRRMLKRLRHATRHNSDDGFVQRKPND